MVRRGVGDGKATHLSNPSEECQGAAYHIQRGRQGEGHGEGRTTAHLSNPSKELQVATCHIQGTPPHPIGHLHPSSQLGKRPGTVLQKVALTEPGGLLHHCV